MNQREHSTFSPVYFYATAPYACSYLDQRIARAQVAVPFAEMDQSLYTHLIQNGFRRSGRMVYRPQCDACQACVSVRIPLAEFKADRSQMRAYKKHSNLEAKIIPLEFHAEHYALYVAYQEHRHSESNMAHDSIEDYSEFILDTPTESTLVEFREEGVLKMVSLIDWLDDGLSAVYTFYDPNDKSCSYGVYSVLWQIEQARSLYLPYVYLGYWIDGCHKMKYKERYRPMEKLLGREWQMPHSFNSQPPGSD
jgi:arginyl-tRNA--protein-N-Asp/Glu arginylyltransferase